ncbi:hypothetical protein HaLaN_00792 [Haematococcus lacustris]|uniref:Uncharacterized protein n=1 Tax=Haematococcus lacustris TaxID=44745 RepID=A0A699YSW3_HAELA|nr:hypothetical protein HaLaN_00792 [Haematococcus lacustris]
MGAFKRLKKLLMKMGVLKVSEPTTACLNLHVHLFAILAELVCIQMKVTVIMLGLSGSGYGPLPAVTQQPGAARAASPGYLAALLGVSSGSCRGREFSVQGCSAVKGEGVEVRLAAPGWLRGPAPEGAGGQRDRLKARPAG